MAASVWIPHLDRLGQRVDSVEKEVALLAKQLRAFDAGGDIDGERVC